jgi:hypothetical protein
MLPGGASTSFRWAVLCSILFGAPGLYCWLFNFGQFILASMRDMFVNRGRKDCIRAKLLSRFAYNNRALAHQMHNALGVNPEIELVNFFLGGGYRKVYLFGNL